MYWGLNNGLGSFSGRVLWKFCSVCYGSTLPGKTVYLNILALLYVFLPLFVREATKISVVKPTSKPATVLASAV